MCVYTVVPGCTVVQAIPPSSPPPGLVLSVCVYRGTGVQAIECRKKEELLQKVQLGLDVAVTEGAKKRLVRGGGDDWR